MKAQYRLVTAMLLITALALYIAGFSGGGVACLAAAIVLDVLFWIRTVRGSARVPREAAHR